MNVLISLENSTHRKPPLCRRRQKQPAFHEKLQQQADAITERIHKVQDLYFDGEITKEEKMAAIERYTKEQAQLNNQIQSIRLGADKQMKKKLLGSMFPQKIEFDGKNHRTTAINDGPPSHLQGNQAVTGKAK